MEGSSSFSAADAITGVGFAFGNMSAKRSGRNLSTRFLVSVQITEALPSPEGGTR